MELLRRDKRGMSGHEREPLECSVESVLHGSHPQE